MSASSERVRAHATQLLQIASSLDNVIAPMLDSQSETILEQRETIQALQARVAELEAGQPPIPPPTSVVARVNAYGNHSWATFLGCHIMTDSSVNAGELANYNGFFAAYQPRPAGGFGRYLSGSDVLLRTRDKHPFECVDGRLLDPAWLIASGYPDPARKTVNIAIPAAAERFAELILAEFNALPGYSILYLDNISHPDNGDRRFTWAQRCDFLERIQTQLPTDVRLFVNCTNPLGGWKNEDLLRICDSCDGMTLEQALHPNYRNDPLKTQAAIVDAQEMVQQGLTVIFCPRKGSLTVDDFERERQFAAGFALLCREHADSPIFGTAGSQPPPDGIQGKAAPEWFQWAERLGQPQSAEDISAFPEVRRTYEHGTLILNVQAGLARVEWR